MPEMVPDRRRREIPDRVGASGAVRVADPAEPPQASDTTVRRVPDRLARDADVRTVRGIPGTPVVTVPSHATELLQDGPATGRTVVLPGGVRTPSDALVGPLTTAALRTPHAGRCFPGVHGLREQDGLTTPNTEEAGVDRPFLQRCDRGVVPADSTQWGLAGLPRIAGREKVDTVVVDDGLDATAREIGSGSVPEVRPEPVR